MKWRLLSEELPEEGSTVLSYNPRLEDDPNFSGHSVQTSNAVFLRKNGIAYGYTHWAYFEHPESQDAPEPIIRINIKRRPRGEDQAWLTENIGARTWSREKRVGWLQHHRPESSQWSIGVFNDHDADLVRLYFG
ncbi:MAG: hypothetical protein EOO77_38915 [Oxalobacteraceae bacterium]|nr:MAG: hypothetical protein EOO77_38915 [Oxalobacteraceae bacterium]